MPCKKVIRENIIEDIDSRLEDALRQTLDIAEQKAADINVIYGPKTVTIVDNRDHLDREINIPETVVDRYYDSELKIEKLTNANPQQEDTERAGEDYTPDYLLQINDIPSSKSSPETLSKIKDAAKKMGIDIQKLSDYLKGNPNIDSKGINGIADLVKGVIAIAHGMENTTLTEEYVHIATSMLEQTNPKLITELISKIDRFKIYKTVLDSYGKRKDYQLSNGKPDIRKIKKEAIDKLLSEVIINNSENKTDFPELLEEKNISMIQQWWNTIKDYIKGIYRKTNIDIFNEVENKIINQTNTQNEPERISSKVNETLRRTEQNSLNLEGVNIPKSFTILWKESPNKSARRADLWDAWNNTSRRGVAINSIISDYLLHSPSYQQIKGKSIREIFQGETILGKELVGVERNTFYSTVIGLRITQSIYGNQFNRGIADRLKLDRITFIDKEGGHPMYTTEGGLFINTNKHSGFLNSILDISSPDNEGAYIDMTIAEELIHLVSAKLTSPEEQKAAYLELSQKNKNDIKRAYYNKEDISHERELTEFQYVHEYVRMKIQDKAFNRTTESIKDHLNSIIKMVWDYIKDLIPYYKNLSDVYDKTLKFIETGEGELNNNPSEGILGLPQIKNDALDKAFNLYKEMARRMQLNPDSVNDKRHYTFDGTRVASSVTEKTKKSNKMPTRSATDKISDEIKRYWGDEGGHRFQEQDLLVNFINKDGYAKENPTDEDIESPFNSAIKKQIHNFNRELISSYPKGTRFLIEEMVINQKEKGMLASTEDFKALVPNEDEKTKDKIPFFVDTLDWKFTSIDKKREDDIPWYKIKDWVPQMGEYNNMDVVTYGIKREQLRKSRMIPFILNFKYDEKGNIEYPSSIEIGKLDSLTETNLYLLPVPTDEELKDNPVKPLIKALEDDYDRLQKVHFEPEEKNIKTMRLKEISKAIRLLRLKLDFAPLTNIGQKFLVDAKKAFKAFEDIDYKQLDGKSLNNKQRELSEFKLRAGKFAKLDKTFLLVHSRESLSEEEKKVLNGYLDSKGIKVPGLIDIAASAERMIDKITELQRLFIVQYSVITGFVTEENKEDILIPEREVKGILSYVTEESMLGIGTMKLGVHLGDRLRSKTNMLMGKALTEFEKLVLPLEQFAKTQGKSAFDLYARIKDGDIQLVEKVDDDFKNELAKAKKEKNKQFLMDNLNLELYNKLSKQAIERGIEEIELTKYSSEEKDNIASRKYAITRLKNSLDIESDSFDGYSDPYHFAPLFDKTRNTDLHLSEGYKQMAKHPEVLAFWEFLVGFNERAIQRGILPYGSLSFFPLIEASMLAKLGATSNLLKEAKDLWQDQYTVRINEENQYSSNDPNTNLPRQKIPKLFTRTDKALHQLSRDATRVFPLWIKSVLEYEMADDLNMTMATLIEVEKSKGHIVVDKSNKIVWEETLPQIDLSSNKNTDLLINMRDDLVFGRHQDKSSVGNINLAAIVDTVSTDKDKVDNRVISIEKGIENMNSITQNIAVGLRWLIAVPNYFGNHFQSIINNGGIYNYLDDFLPNHGKSLISNLSTMQKGLLDLIVPLNGDPYTEARRKIAWKQGYIKWLGTWNMQEFMQSTNYLPERNLQFTNALAFIGSSMVINGRIVSIRQYLEKQDQEKYKKDNQGNFIMSYEERKEYKKSFEKRVDELKKSPSALLNIAKIENDQIVIPGVDEDALADFRTKVVAWGRNLNGQMSAEDKARYRRDVLLKSFAMFRNWIVRQVTVRGHEIMENKKTEQWEYGRMRAFMKAYIQACSGSIFKMIDIINGTDKGLAILDAMLEQKKDAYYKKHGRELKITNEEFYDMMHQILVNEMKELSVLLGLMILMLGAKIAVPDDDDDLLDKNRKKMFFKVFLKIKNEVDFYYSPISFMSMTKGSFLPALGTIGNAWTAVTSLGQEIYGYATDNEELRKKNYPLKRFLNIIPGPSQFTRDYAPLIFPEWSKEHGYVVSPQARPGQGQ